VKRSPSEAALTDRSDEVGHWHSPEGDLMISIPDKKVVMAIDGFSAGATPFMNLDLTENMREYLKYGREDAWAVASLLIQAEVDQCAKDIKSRWITKFEGVDIWAASHCRTAIIYAEWDVGSR
jgi:hypothetical protein